MAQMRGCRDEGGRRMANNQTGASGMTWEDIEDFIQFGQSINEICIPDQIETCAYDAKLKDNKRDEKEPGVLELGMTRLYKF